MISLLSLITQDNELHLWHFSEWVDQGSHHRVQFPMVASLIHLYT